MSLIERLTPARRQAGAKRRGDYPLITPIGRIRATFCDRPAWWTTSTTSSTFLYAFGCSSARPLRLWARAMTPRASSSLSIRRPRGVLDRGGAAHRPAGAVAGRAERLLHAARLADQHPARPAHVAGDDHRLADLAVQRRHLRMARRERPRRPLAMDPDLLLDAVDRVLLELGDVVAHVVDQVHLQLLPRSGRRRRRRPRGPAASAAGGCTRRSWRPRAWRAMYCWPSGLSTGAQASCRSGRSMPYFSGALRSVRQGVVAHLVAQAARAGVDHDADHVLLQAHDLGGLLVEDVIDDLHFEEVVARAERAALLARRAPWRGR